jgi:hypothetical protein
MNVPWECLILETLNLGFKTVQLCCYLLNNLNAHSLLSFRKCIITQFWIPVVPVMLLVPPLGIKGKVVPVLFFFNWAPRQEGVLGEWTYSCTHSVTSVVDGSEWSASRYGRFTPKERTPNTHWIGGWMGPRTDQDAVVKRVIPSLAGNRTLEPWLSSP